MGISCGHTWKYQRNRQKIAQKLRKEQQPLKVPGLISETPLGMVIDLNFAW
jgi:hypothetical protein